jgi:rubredoxin
VARADGWRYFKGKSVTGKDLDDVICPACAGTAKPEPDGLEKSWRVRCETCDWSYDEGWEPGDDLIVDARDAKSVADDHRCQRVLRIAPAVR